ncbi:MAG: hypothetical protein D4R67_10585, partial [Bacteroidetes bacterium]
MKTKIIFSFFLALVFILVCGSDVMAGKKKIRFVVSEPDAKIFVDGRMIGTGQADIIVPAYACIVVKIEKPSMLTEVIEFCNKPDFAPPPKNYNLLMQKDDAWDASEKTDIANVDIEVKTTKPELEAWKLLS